jgi:hypothetical protein
MVRPIFRKGRRQKWLCKCLFTIIGITVVVRIHLSPHHTEEGTIWLMSAVSDELAKCAYLSFARRSGLPELITIVRLHQIYWKKLQLPLT